MSSVDGKLMTINTNEVLELDLEVKIRTLHVCVLVHGHKGYSSDLSYLTSQLNIISKKKYELLSDCLLLVHSAVCNEDNTDDGIINGGTRLMEEVKKYLAGKIQQFTNLENVTLSFVGNSLGNILH